MAPRSVLLAGWILALLTCSCGGGGERRDPPAAASATPTVVVAPGEPSSGAVVAGLAPPAVGGFPSVVTLEQAGERRSAGREPDASTGNRHPSKPGASGPPIMDQVASAFYPPTLLARLGQEIQFANSENVMHNVNVASDRTGLTLFNIATPPGFEDYRRALPEPGVYRVTCDIHPGMSAFIVVVTTPHAAVADRNGRFTIRRVPAGSYEAAVWSLDAARQTRRRIEIPSGQASLELDLVTAAADREETGGS